MIATSPREYLQVTKVMESGKYLLFSIDGEAACLISAYGSACLAIDSAYTLANSYDRAMRVDVDKDVLDDAMKSVAGAI